MAALGALGTMSAMAGGAANTVAAGVVPVGQGSKLKIDTMTIVVTLILAVIYMITAAAGIGTFSDCPELADKKIHQNLSRLLSATLAIALAIPFTLFIAMVSKAKLTGVLTLVYSVMGIIGSAIALNYSRKCNAGAEDKKVSTVYNSLSLITFIVALMVGGFLVYKKPKFA